MKKKWQLVWSLALVFPLALSDPFATAGVEIVEIEKVQVVGCLSGVVRDPSGAPLPGAKVEEVSPDWKAVIQSTTTDSAGFFSMTPQSRRRIYYLVIRLSGFNPMRVQVRINTGSTKQLDIQLEVST
jgi:hypothetical protein